MNEQFLQPKIGKDRYATTLGMALAAFCLGIAIDANNGTYSPAALFWLTMGTIVAVGVLLLPLIPRLEIISRDSLRRVLVIGIIFQAGLLLRETYAGSSVNMGLLLIAVLGAMQAFCSERLRIPILAVMLIAFCIVSVVQFLTIYNGFPGIDVYVFQQQASDAFLHGKITSLRIQPSILLQGRNPYAMRFPNIYEPNTPFYGPGVVDDKNYLTYGFPYPPLSLLMVLPGYWLGGDCRYSMVVAMALSAALMATARPGRWGALAAMLFLLTPKAFYVFDFGWTEPLLTLNFSVVMFCACRCRKWLPYALGLYFATKQYTCLTLPALVLLTEGPRPWRELGIMVLKAGLVATVITLPFFLWNPWEFIRAIVLWQLVQPFRMDALSYLVWIYHHNGGHRPPIWTPFVAVIPAMILGVWRAARSPAGFAVGVTLVNLAFFAFNKQAFCNYYYFVLATACWVVAGADSGPVSSDSSVVLNPAS
jgi:hypothetical protein